MITSEEIKSRLWDGANELRGSMDASRYKDFMLGLMFYKFLSDKTLSAFKILTTKDDITEADLVAKYHKSMADRGAQLETMLQNTLGYYVLPKYLYQTWIEDINKGKFEVQNVIDSLNYFERSIVNSKDVDDFKDLFSPSTLDLTDTALGSNLHERSKNIKALILLFADLNMVALQKGDVLGDAYEYLIGQFAMESGKKAGEFYTPRQVSEVMAQIAAKTSNIRSIYDPTVGSGSLLLTVKKHLAKEVQQSLTYYGQEKNTATYNLARMNLLLHEVKPNKMTIKNGDTLAHDWPEDPAHPNEGVQFDAVVMNPPYSVKNWNRAGLKVSDPRFEIAGVLPPDSKGDFAFLLHGLFHLGQSGTMTIVLPHGILFRGAAEGEIRKRLLEKNYIDAVIGLPSNLFTNTGIPVVILVLKKNRQLTDPVLIIDASNTFIKVGKQNVLQEKDIAKIVDTYVSRQEQAGYSHLANRQEIIANEYNLNIPRYIEAIDDDIAHDVEGHLLGGIPQQNIDQLAVIRATTPDLLQAALEPIRPQYLTLKEDISELSTKILNDARVTQQSAQLAKQTQAYIERYWSQIIAINNPDQIHPLMEAMLNDIKSLLASFNYIDIYDGYQIIAEIWQNSLLHDTEIIAATDFYTAARNRIPNMVSKGSGAKKRLEQDGFVSSLIPSELIATELYADHLANIDHKKQQIQTLESELADLVEAAKVEDSIEYDALYESLKKNDDDEPLDTFDNKKLKQELKTTPNDSECYSLLKKVDKLISQKSALSKQVKTEELALKEAVQERILILTDEEIDTLMYKKWFGNTIALLCELIEKPIKAELKTLQMLNERYQDTLTSIDKEIEQLEAELQAMMQDLVVTQ
ncbi:type I restriction-modification system subunit M [Snodgrassella alvi]|uniref:site-specific DNA-methyltransferase (adenine-specific) n=1 Tax=Snodgrassella alvi TaxID=1196083 RepID=A0A2N9XX94_9NEIS|nr:type I restriction-modification system subunit M [Snodgrassella alvi]PIT54501.1 type I restriction-modification system subunit M [Snodgrassella alvi]